MPLCQRYPTHHSEEVMRARWAQGHVEVEQCHEGQAASFPGHVVQALISFASLVSEGQAEGIWGTLWERHSYVLNKP